MAAEPKIELFNADWRDILPRYESNWFDLAIVDPPYGINVNMGTLGKRKNDRKKYEQKSWDLKPPSPVYFEELKRVSKNQIIWGANHVYAKKGAGWIVWNKVITGNVPFSKAELAYSSFDRAVNLVDIPIQSLKEERIHPTQKPVALYRWLLQNYAKEGDKILDTHLGSGSIAIACFEEKFDLVACEIDEDYFAAMKKRYDEYRKQLQLFS